MPHVPLSTLGADYRGRFAPSPSGPLHFGSLVAAVGSFLEARRHGGRWLVRIDDLDPPREVPGAADAILRALDAFGLEWDEPVVYQSRRMPAYEEAFRQLVRDGWAYPCGCTRRQIAAVGRHGPAGAIYPGTCRGGLPAGRQARSWRVTTANSEIHFEDTLQGFQHWSLETEIGDFVVRRADKLFSYHLACAVDDAAAGITHIVRGYDLLASTPPQIHLQRALSLPTPVYGHLPLATHPDGDKLSKQTAAPGIDGARAGPELWAALAFLRQQPPTELRNAGLSELWDWASAHWDPAPVKGLHHGPVPQGT